MRLFRAETDEELIERFERATQERLNKFFDKMDGFSDFPGESNILGENDIYAQSFEKINENSGRINIGYTSERSTLVAEGIRVRIEVYHIGSILCTDIKNIREIETIKKSTIKVSFFSKEKTIQFPVNQQPSLEIVCKKLIIEKFGLFAMREGKLIPLNEQLEHLGKVMMAQYGK